MSGPNTDYDPVEVTPLKADQVEAMREAALAAIADAADLDALKQVRLDHAGDRSPLALANREIGALPPQARKEAGQRVGQARGAVNQAIAARQAVLEAEHEERMLVEETVDVSLPDDPPPPRRPAPADPAVRAHRRPLRGHGLRGRRGPGRRGRVAQLRRPQPRPRPPGAHHAGHLLDRAGRPPRRAAHPDLARAGAHDADPQAADLRRLPGPGVPHRRVRRHALADVPPGRGPRGRRGHHHGPPQGHARPLRLAAVRRRHHHPVPAVLLPLHRAVRRGRRASASCAAARCRRGARLVPHLPRRGLDRVGRLRRGQPARPHRLRRRPGGLQRLRLRHGHRPVVHVPPRPGGPASALRGRRPVQPARSAPRSERGERR